MCEHVCSHQNTATPRRVDQTHHAQLSHRQMQRAEKDASCASLCYVSATNKKHILNKKKNLAVGTNMLTALPANGNSWYKVRTLIVARCCGQSAVALKHCSVCQPTSGSSDATNPEHLKQLSGISTSKMLCSRPPSKQVLVFFSPITLALLNTGSAPESYLD